jgi:ribosomal protein L5
MVSSNFYYENIIRSVLLSKYCYTNVHEIPFFKECIITISFPNENVEDDISILYALTLLELLTSQKPYIEKVSSIYKSKIKILVFTFKVSLNKTNLFDFFLFLSLIALPLFKLRYIKRNLNIDNKSFNYSFAFKDTNIFPSLPEVYYKWNSLLNLSFTVGFTEKCSIKEIEDFYNFFYLVSDFNSVNVFPIYIENYNDDDDDDTDFDDFVISDAEILSMSFFNTKKSLAIFEIEKKNNEKKEHQF